MIIRLRHRSQNEYLVWILLFGPFLIAPLLQFAGLPGAVKYILDVVWFFFVSDDVIEKKKTLVERGKIPFTLDCCFLFDYSSELYCELSVTALLFMGV